jgi:carbon monoxide dehydrogenase subunit G
MRFEEAVEVEAPGQRVWEVLSDIEAWPRVVRTVEAAEAVTPPPLTVGSIVRLRQPKLPEGQWDITAWDPPVSFELTQKTGGVTSVASHRVDAIGEGRSRLTLTLEMRGLMVAIVGLFYKKLTQSYLEQEAQDLKRAAEGVS